MIGLPALENLIMAHSVKSLFVLRNPALKKLFKTSWERIIYKAATSQFLAGKLGFRPAEEAMTASILTEVGTLPVLSAFNSDIPVPNEETYFKLCRLYSKSLGTILLRKWGLESYLIEVTQSCGQWGFKQSKELALIDIINLAIYSTVKHQSKSDDLPPIETLPSYQKLPASLNALNKDNQLMIIQNNLQIIDKIISSIRWNIKNPNLNTFRLGFCEIKPSYYLSISELKTFFFLLIGTQ